MMHSIAVLILAILGSLGTVYSIAKAMPHLYRQRFVRMAIDSTLHSMRITLSPFYWTARTVATKAPVIRTITARINTFIDARIDGQWLEAWCSKRFAEHPNPLLRGDIQCYAALQYPIEEYPWLWRPSKTDLAPVFRIP